MFLKFLKNMNLGKAGLVSVTIYIIAFMAAVWAPWDSSPLTVETFDQFKKDLQIGFHIYYLLVIAFILMANFHWEPLYSGRVVCAIWALLWIPQQILAHYGTENLFSLPWSVLQMACTAVLAYLIFEAKECRQPQIPA